MARDMYLRGMGDAVGKGGWQGPKFEVGGTNSGPTATNEEQAKEAEAWLEARKRDEEILKTL